MSEPVLTAQDLIAWLETTTANWRKLLTAHPELLAVPCDINGVRNVAEFLQHIVAVELRYAQRLATLPVTEYAEIPFDSIEAIYATHDRAMEIFQRLLVSDIDWNASIEFSTRVMNQALTDRRTLLFHTLTHSIRHYAQLSTLARQHGVKPAWPMDYLFMNLRPA